MLTEYFLHVYIVCGVKVVFILLQANKYDLKFSKKYIEVALSGWGTEYHSVFNDLTPVH